MPIEPTELRREAASEASMRRITEAVPAYSKRHLSIYSTQCSLTVSNNPAQASGGEPPCQNALHVKAARCEGLIGWPDREFWTVRMLDGKSRRQPYPHKNSLASIMSVK